MSPSTPVREPMTAAAPDATRTGDCIPPTAQRLRALTGRGTARISLAITRGADDGSGGCP